MTGARTGLGRQARRHRTVDDMNTSTAEEQRVMDLHGQRVVILGGTSGIGLAAARAAPCRGAEVIVVSRHPASTARALAQLPPAPPRPPPATPHPAQLFHLLPYP